MSSQSRPRRRRAPSSIYPLHPAGSRWLARVSETECTVTDRLLVAGSSLVIVGSAVWVPCLLFWSYRQWQKQTQPPPSSSSSSSSCPSSCPSSSPDWLRHRRHRRTAYAALIVAALGVYAMGPHRHHRVGEWLRIRKWKLWRAWLRFLAVEIVLDSTSRNNNPPNDTAPSFDLQRDDAILAFVPHGIFPFAFGIGTLTDLGQRIFGVFRPMVATAVLKVPILGDIVTWLHALDADRTSVDEALRNGQRVGLVPGGIDEMFTGYPRPGCHPDQEYAIVKHGFLRLAARYQKRIIPIYCFGSTKLFQRWHVPALEYLSHLLRASLIAFYGVCGLPIPFRQRLTYIVGDPIVPPPLPVGRDGPTEDQVRALHDQFCRELQRLFERHKEAYGWGHKTLHLLSK